MSDDTYNGWSNRETWALMLWVNNDEGLQSEVVGRVVRADFDLMISRDRELADVVGEWRELAEAGEGAAGLRMVLNDIGSVWRVNWTECVNSLMEDHAVVAE